MGIQFPLQAARLHKLRKEHGYTQAAVAKRIGCTLRTYRFWETGEKQPSTELLMGLADLYGVSCDYLLCRIDEKNHDLKFIHDETGLSEKAIEALQTLKYGFMSLPESQGFLSDIISRIIEHERFRYFIYRLMQSQKYKTNVTESHQEEQQQIEASFNCLKSYGYQILAPGKNNIIAINDAKQEISGIIDDLFRYSETEFIELRD